MITALIAGSTMGLLGSLHCIGMCGPIALSLPVHSHRGLSRMWLQLSYNAGRAFTYTVFGIIAGLAGQAILLASSGRILSVAAGLLVMFSALMISPLQSRLKPAGILNRLKILLSEMLRARTKRSFLLVGLLNGLLPCGLVYMALSVAVAQGEAVRGAAVMAAFGLATFPVMMALPYAGSFIGLRFRNSMRKTLPYFIGLTGLLLVLRGLSLGIPYISPAFEPGNASCHEASVHPHNLNNNISCTGPVSAPNR